MLFQIPTLAWALVLALVIMTSSASSASVAGSGTDTTATETNTAIDTATIPPDKVNALITQAIVLALVADTLSPSSSKSNKENIRVKGKTITLAPPPPPHLPPLSCSQGWVLSGLRSIVIELDKVEIGGLALSELWALRANVKSAEQNYGNVKIFTTAGGSSQERKTASG
ncbi:hypothetical protein BGZ93_006578 [Podila epicladia]|nr:hypothetical protein BGZ92_004113 [Podila epicladia]KAG0094893.1 hypothetical protein BGZ93_006578 [Podila epicladia]